MSGECVGWVYRHSPAKGGTFQVHQALADSANDQNGYELWMRIPALARKARMSPGATRKAVAWLIENDLLEVLDDGKAHEDAGSATRPRRFRFLMPDGVDVVFDTHPRRGRGPTGLPAPTTRGARPRRGPRADDAGDLEPKADPKPKPKNPPPAAPSDAPAEPDVPDVDAPEVTDEHKRVAREVTRNVWDRRDPKPTTPFIALQKIAERFLALGYERQEVGRAMFDAPTITLRSVELNLGKMRGKGATRTQTTAAQRRGGITTDRTQAEAPWAPGQPSPEPETGGPT